MSIQLEDLLDSLRTHGTIDSTGEFSVDVQRAQSIVPAYQTSDPYLFLVAVVSAGFSAGAERAEVRTQKFPSRLVLELVNADLPVEELEDCYNTQKSTADESLLDLLLGIRAAFQTEVSKIEILSSSGALSVAPKKAELEAFKKIEAAGLTRITFHYPVFKSFFQTRQSAFDRPAVTHLREMGQWSRRAILVEKVNILKNYDIGSSEYHCTRVGELEESRFQQPIRSSVEGYSWSGALSLRKGKLQLVLHGIVRGTLEHPYFSGVIYHPDFRLDVSREQIVLNDAVREIETDLEALFTTLLEDLLNNLDLSAETVPWYFYFIWTACVAGDIGAKGQTRLSEWFAQALATRKIANRPSTPLGQSWHEAQPKPELTPAQKLVRQAAALQYAEGTNFKLEYSLLLKTCQRLLEQDVAGNIELLETILEVLAEHRPKQTLLRAYLLLGIGANHKKSGNQVLAERAWAKALKTVSGRRHRAQEQLIRAHLDFDLEHILSETLKLLEIQIRALENDQWL